MKARWHNPRVVALVIYALVVNLAWVAAASSHHIDLTGAWCSQIGSEQSDPAHVPPADAHHDCQHFCGAHGVTGLVPVAVLPSSLPIAASELRPIARAPRGWTSTGWQARAPPRA